LKNEDGLVYWPEFNIDLIGDLLPGKAYRLSVNFPMDFSYSANSMINTEKGSGNVEPKHFNKAKITNSNMILGIPYTAWDVIPEINDEIAIFDEHGTLVGSSVFTGGNMSLAIFGNDELSENKDGLLFANELQYLNKNNELDNILNEFNKENNLTDNFLKVLKSGLYD